MELQSPVIDRGAFGRAPVVLPLIERNLTIDGKVWIHVP